MPTDSTGHRAEESDHPAPDAADVACLGDVDDVVTAVLTASRALVAVSARSLASVEDTLTLPQFRMLVVLDTRGELSLTRLAEHLAVNPSTAMRMAERLTTMGAITRRNNPADRRTIRLTLTDTGRRTVTDVTARRRAEISDIVSAIPSDQRAELVRALRNFAAAGGEPAVVNDW